MMATHVDGKQVWEVVTPEQFLSEFKHVRDVRMGEGVVVDAKTPLKTTGIATCIAVVALVLNASGHVLKHALFHLDGTDNKTFATWLVKIHSAYTKFYLFGGYDLDTSLDAIKHIMRLKGTVAIEDHTNPWNIQDGYEDHDVIMDRVGYRLDVGVAPSGRIMVVDHVDSPQPELYTMNGFLQYDAVALAKVEEREA